MQQSQLTRLRRVLVPLLGGLSIVACSSSNAGTATPTEAMCASDGCGGEGGMGAVFEGEIMVKPFSVRMGAATRASLEQEVPMMAMMVSSAASFWAAA